MATRGSILKRWLVFSLFGSFSGEVSTRNKDFLVDPFDIFEQMHLLNEASPAYSHFIVASFLDGQIFSDPRILKVLHGADRLGLTACR